MAPISLRENKIQELTEDFIEQLTGFKKSSRNFNLSVQFALSNFRYHRFLDVDSAKVTRLVQGVVKKIHVHSQYEKAAALEELCESFLGLPLSEDDPTIKTDVHYSLILFLLQLSDSPTHVNYQPKEPSIQDKEEAEFDWKTYLLGDAEEPILGIPHDDSCEVIWSDDEQGDDDTDFGTTVDSGMGHSRSTTDQEMAIQEMTIHRYQTPAEKGHTWLFDHITSQYWDEFSVDNNNQKRSTGNCALSAVWQEFQQIQNPFAVAGDRMLTETQLVRETLWMLSGIRSSYVYGIHGNVIEVRQGVEVSHLSPESLQVLLKRFASTGKQILEILNYISSVLDSNSQKPETTQTAQAFTTSLSSYFTMYKTRLAQLQKTIINHESPVTLIGLHDELRDVHDEIQTLYTVYRNGVASCLDLSNPRRTGQLLDVFYKTLCWCDDQGKSVRRKVALLLDIFLDTVRPYIEFIDGWVTSGDLRDPMTEFFIQRNVLVSLESTEFWECGITLRAEQSGGTVNGGGIIPCFLQDSVKQILLAGKSVNLIQGLGKMTNSFMSSSESCSLCETFVKNFISCIKKKSLSTGNENNPAEPKGLEPHGDLLGLVESRAVTSMTQTIGDPMLRETLLTSFMIKTHDRNINSRHQTRSDQLHKAIQTCMVPIDVLFTSTLTPLIQAKYRVACGALIRLLKAEYSLMDHLAAMRNFYLLEAGDTMNYFYTDIFRKIRRRQSWQDTSYLNSLLQEALQDKYPHCVGRLAVSLATNTSGFKGTSIQTLQAMALSYKVPWPVSVVIDESSQKKYNQILMFLLTLKRAKWCLDVLRFSDLTGQSRRRITDLPSSDEEKEEEDEDPYPSDSSTPIDHALVHKMYILRFRLLHFVNNLHNYIMTRILHTTGLEFQEEIAKAKDFDDVVDVHKSYVSKVYDRCLLSQKIGFVKDAITKVLNVTLAFQSMWDLGIRRISSGALTKVEGEFSKCNHFVVTFLENLVKRGAFPHLESLAHSLSMDAPIAKKDFR